MTINSKLKIYFFISFLLLLSCQKQEEEGKYPCLDGNCDATFEIPGDSVDANGYHHVKFKGYNYFQVKGKLDELNSEYIINGVPLVEVGFDSDFWVLFDTIRYRYPVYSFLGLYTDKRYKDPIPIGNRTYTMVDIANLIGPINIAGYQIPKKFTGWDKPYATTMMGTYSKYTYTPTQNFFIDDEMVGDTATLFMRAVFNNDFGRQDIKYYSMNVVFD